MTAPLLPLIVEADELEAKLGTANLLVVDLSRPEVYAQYHIPGAVHLDYAKIVRQAPPVMGLLPEPEQLNELFSSIGLTPETHVVAYDDEGGGKASRLLWTLDACGHTRHSLLNGGLHAWANEGHALDSAKVSPQRSDYRARRNNAPIATKDYILAHLGQPGFALLDARSPGEYRGADRRAARGGHIPGAANLEWTQALDPQRNLRLKAEGGLRGLLAEQGCTPDKEIVTYCQTHHRSALVYVALKALGYPRVKGYPGSWSEWGNDADTPVE